VAPRPEVLCTGPARPRTGNPGPADSPAACSSRLPPRAGKARRVTAWLRGEPVRRSQAGPPRGPGPPRAQSSSASLASRAAGPAGHPASTPRRGPAAQALGTAARRTRPRLPLPRPGISSSQACLAAPGLAKAMSGLARFTGEAPPRVSSSSLVAGRRERFGRAEGEPASKDRYAVPEV
jgi:hypothetical protein